MEIQKDFSFIDKKTNNPIQKIINYFKSYDLHNWVGLIGLLIFTVSMCFTINDFLRYVSKKDEAWKIFFGIFDRFTNQSNWLLFFYMLLYVLCPKHQFFKGYKFLLATMVYIFFTFIGYNVVLVAIAKQKGYSLQNGVTSLVSNVWLHLLAPIYFIVYGYIVMYMNPNKEPVSFVKTLLPGMVYPTIYAIYLISIPYTFKDYRTNYEYYEPIQAAMPDIDLSKVAYSVYGSATNTYSNPISWAYIGVMYFGFFPGSFAIFYYSWKGLNKLNNKK